MLLQTPMPPLQTHALRVDGVQEGWGCRGDLDLDLDLGSILRLTGRLGWSTMASPTTLRIGQPCHVAFPGPSTEPPIVPSAFPDRVAAPGYAPCCCRVRRIRGRHPPARYPSPLASFLRGYGGAAPVALCCFPASGAAAALLLPHVGCSPLQPTPTPLPMQGLWGRCTSNRPAAAAAADAAAAAVMPQWWQLPSYCVPGVPVVLQWLQLLSLLQVSCSSILAAACVRAAGTVAALLLQLVGCSSLQPPPARYQCRGYGGVAPAAFRLQLLLLLPLC